MKHTKKAIMSTIGLLILFGGLAFWHPGQALAGSSGSTCNNQYLTTDTLNTATAAPGELMTLNASWYDQGNSNGCTDAATSAGFVLYAKVVAGATGSDGVVMSGPYECTYPAVADTGQGTSSNPINCAVSFSAPSQVGYYHLEITLVETSTWSNGSTTYDYTHNGGSACWDNPGTFDTETGSGCTSSNSGNVLSEPNGSQEIGFQVQVNAHSLIAKAYPYSTASGTPCASSDSSCGSSTIYITPNTPVSLRAWTTPAESSGSSYAATKVYAVITAPTGNQVWSGYLQYDGQNGSGDEWTYLNINTAGWATGNYAVTGTSYTN